MADVEINLEITDPKELIALGIRAYAIGDFANATAAFGRATQLLAQKNGDEHDSLGEVYVHYARSLLELSREEAEPLGDAIPHGESESDSEDETEVENNKSENSAVEKTEQSTEVQEAKEVREAEDIKVAEKIKEAEEIKEPKEIKEAKTDENKEIETKQNGAAEDKPEDLSSAGPSQEPEEDNENCSDLQLAWEVLEVAKKIFTNRGDSGKELLAETLILLGEVAMESENFSDGIDDLKAGLEIQKTLYDPTNRKLAETYYKVGTAHSTVSNIEEAIQCFKSSIETLKKRIEHLAKTEDEQTVKSSSEEIEEMKALIPEIEEKINDTKSIKEEMTAQLIKEMTQKSEKAKEDGATSSKANDITHLVKRKRKGDETPESEVLPAKRPTP